MPAATHSPAASDRQLRGGIDLGGTKIEAIVVDGENQVLGNARHPTPSTGTPADVAEAMIKAMSEAAEGAGTTTQALLGVGVGSPGAVDAKTGAVADARNLPEWSGSFPLGATLSEKLGARVIVGNDVQVATDAEFRLGAARDYDSVIGVFWGTGVGGGLILGGRPWHGRGGAGEIGHMVLKDGGRRCGCGNRGCLEAYAGRASMERHARRLVAEGRHTKLFEIMERRGRDRLTSAIWWRALEHKDELATELIAEAVEALGAGIASAVNLLDIPAVVIGGGLGVRFGEEYVRRIEHAMRPHLFPGHKPPEVGLVELGDLGGAIGAALQVSAAP
jgi:glucokinase